MTQAKLYIPTAVSEKLHDHVARDMADIAGGYTSYTAQGGWINGSDELIEEPVKVYEIVTERDYDATVRGVGITASFVKEMTDEDSVLFTVDGKAHFR